MVESLDSGVLRLERADLEAHGLAAEIIAAPRDRQLATVTDDPRYHTPAFVSLAVGFCCEPRPDAVQWGRLALTASQCCDSSRVFELQGLVWAALSNALRREGELRRARPAALRAVECLDRIADPLEWAEAASLTASTLLALCDDETAEDLVRRAIDAATGLGQPSFVARLEVQLGMLLVRVERWDEALETLTVAAGRLRGDVDPLLALRCTHNTAAALIALGYPDEGVELLWQAETLYREVGDEVLRLQRRWLEARADLARGAKEIAQARLAVLVEEASEPPHLAALIALEQSEIEIALGRRREAVKTLDMVARTLDALGSPIEALRAVLDLRDAVAQQAAPRRLAAMVAEARISCRRKLAGAA